MESSQQRIARQLGNAVRRLRLGRGRAQWQVAAAAGIPKGALSACERGQRLPSVPALAALLAVLDCSPDEFARHFGPFGDAETIQRRGALL